MRCGRISNEHQISCINRENYSFFVGYLGICRQAKHYDTYIQQLVADGRLLDVTPRRKRDKKYRTNYATK